MKEKILYHIFKLLQRFVNKESKITIQYASLDERAEKYFFYEKQKAENFNKKFGLIFNNKVVLEIGSGYGGHLANILEKYPSFIYGIETDEERARKSEVLLNNYVHNKNFNILCKDAVLLPEIPDSSIDIVISDAVIEHIAHLDKVLIEVKRILKDDGKCYMATSPIWLTYNGGHIINYLPLPWIHLLLPDKIILDILKIQKVNKDYNETAMNGIILLYSTIGKLTIKKLKKSISSSGLYLSSFENYTTSRIKKVLQHLPFGKEVFAGNIMVIVEKEKYNLSA